MYWEIGDLMHSDQFVLDPSFLRLFMSSEFEADVSGSVSLFIPDTLDRLIVRSGDNSDYRHLLDRLVVYFSYLRRSFSASEWNQFYANYGQLKQKGLISLITLDIVDQEIYAYCSEAFDDPRFYISMSPRINLLGDVLGKTLGYSKKHSVGILMRTRKLPNLVRGKITIIELPDRLDKLIISKQRLINNVFSFPGGKFVRFFIAVVIAGAAPLHWSADVLGAAFVFFDP